jgi:hypothetical protein
MAVGIVLLNKQNNMYSKGYCVTTLVGDQAPLQICFLRHAFGLGEHYNSVIALEDSEDEE